MQKILIGISILVAAIIVFSFFSNKETVKSNYKFTGESEHWEGEYVFNGTEKWKGKNNKNTYFSESNYTLTLQYKGPLSELASVKNLSYSYEESSGGGSHTMEFDEPTKDVIFTMSGSGAGTAIIDKDEVIRVTIKWGAFEESFQLQSNGK